MNNKANIFTAAGILVILVTAAVSVSGCSSIESARDITNNPMGEGAAQVVSAEVSRPDTSDGNAVELLPAQRGEFPEPDDTSAAAEIAELIEEFSEQEMPEEPEKFTDEDDNIDSFYISDYAPYDLTPSQRDFTKRSIFVGDSICMGFGEYNITADKRVYARGNLAAWSFYDYVFYYGEEDEEISYSEVLKRTKPQFVFLSMGMNDINMTDEEQFCENYSRIIEHTLLQSSADVYVCAITPVDSAFTTNEKIDLYNQTMAQYIEERFSGRVHFIDYNRLLRDEEGKLPEHFTSGDGIHLGPHAYYIALWEMYNTLVADGLYDK